MLTISDLDERKDIKNIEVKGLKAYYPNNLGAMLSLSVVKDAPPQYAIEISLDDDVNPDLDVTFDDLLPTGYIPKFLIDAKVFVDTMMTIEDTYTWALGMAVMASTEVKLKFLRKGNEFVTILSIGAFVTKKRMPLESAKHVFEPAER